MGEEEESLMAGKIKHVIVLLPASDDMFNFIRNVYNKTETYR